MLPVFVGQEGSTRNVAALKKNLMLMVFAAGIRMKGGVRFDEQNDGYVAIVHTWDNVYCKGEPTEWRSPKIFPTEEEAMKYYKLSIRPDMQRMISKIENDLSDGTLIHRKLE